jgi:hypothetical protein
MRKMLNEWRKFLDEDNDASDEQLAKVAAQRERMAAVKELAKSVYAMSTQPGPGLPFEPIHGMDPKDLDSLIRSQHDDVEAAQAIIDALRAGDVDDIRDAIAKRNKSDAATAKDIYRTPYQKSATK